MLVQSRQTSSLGTMATVQNHHRVALLLSGYFKAMEKLLDQNIPTEISEMIGMYHKIKDLGFAIGHDEFMNSNCFLPLPQLWDLRPSMKNIYRNNESLMIITPDNQLYAMGNNSGTRLGIDFEEENGR